MKAIIISLLAILTLTACSNYGKKVTNSNIEVFYKDGVSEEQAQKTADLLHNLDTESSAKKSFQLNINGDTIICKMVVNQEKVDEILDASFEAIGTLISDSVFNGKPVNMDLTTNKFKTLRIVYFKKNEPSDPGITNYGKKIMSGNVELFVTDEASMEVGESLVQFLDKEMTPSDVISFQLTKDSYGMNSVRMVSTAEKVAGLSDETITNMAAKISSEIFNGSPIIFEFTDSYFKTIKTFTYDPE